MTTANRPQHASGSAADEVISPTAFQILVEMLGVDPPQHVVEFIDIYLDQAAQLVESVRGAVEHDDPPAMLLAVHSLKSSSSFVGALQLSALCAVMEQAIGSGDAFDAAAMLEAIEEEHRRVRRALHQRRQQLLNT